MEKNITDERTLLISILIISMIAAAIMIVSLNDVSERLLRTRLNEEALNASLHKAEGAAVNLTLMRIWLQQHSVRSEYIDDSIYYDPWAIQCEQDENAMRAFLARNFTAGTHGIVEIGGGQWCVFEKVHIINITAEEEPWLKSPAIEWLYQDKSPFWRPVKIQSDGGLR